MKRPLEVRFWEKVEKTESCWLWTASVTAAGYGNFKVSGVENKTAYAHRLSYELLVGPIPNGLVLDHLCRNTRCVNPAHLEAVTQQVNVHRGEGSKLGTHCPNGHEYTSETLRVYKSKRYRGYVRKCVVCKRNRDRERAARKRNH